MDKPKSTTPKAANADGGWYHPKCVTHPHLYGRWNPDAEVTAVPWPEHLVIFCDSDGSWWASDSGSWSQRCPRCRGSHTLDGGAAQFCPHCGTALDPDKARWIADETND